MDIFHGYFKYDAYLQTCSLGFCLTSLLLVLESFNTSILKIYIIFNLHLKGKQEKQ
jgi:hypothetical protein